MALVRTDLRLVEEAASRIRYYPKAPLSSTDMQDAIDEISGLINVPGEPFPVTTANATIGASVRSVVIERVAPVATQLILPKVADRAGLPLIIKDWSTAIADEHNITLVPDGAETIERISPYIIRSNSAYLVGVTLIPSVDLNGWYIGS